MHLLRPFAALLLICALIGSSPALGIPAPMPVSQLEAMASHIVEGEVVKVAYLSTSRNGSYSGSVFEADLKVSKVTKGKIQPGQTITIRFSTESWVGPGRQPPGRAPHPAYYPCELVRAYLQAGKNGNVYFTAAWNGRQGLRTGVFRLPDKVGAPLRCVAGKVR